VIPQGDADTIEREHRKVNASESERRRPCTETVGSTRKGTRKGVDVDSGASEAKQFAEPITLSIDA